MKTRLLKILYKFISKRHQIHRKRVYHNLSTNTYSGTPTIRQPVLFIGDGEIKFGNNNNLGYFPSPFYYSGYCHIEARRKKSQIIFTDNIHINNNLVIISENRVEIGSNVLIGTNVEIYDSDFHSTNTKRFGEKNYRTAPVKIGDNVWIGSNVKILKGVEIGENSVISNGSIVTKSIPPDAIAGGIPAKKIKSIE